MRKFICECEIPERDRLIGDPELQSLDTVTYDSEGFMVCKVHRQRRYGWRSLPVIDSSAGRRADSKLAAYSPLVIERIVEFQEIPSSFDIPQIQLNKAEKDRRDNSDPETLGNSMLAMGSRPSNTNGKWLKAIRPAPNPKAGRALMEYHRRIAS